MLDVIKMGEKDIIRIAGSGFTLEMAKDDQKQKINEIWEMIVQSLNFFGNITHNEGFELNKNFAELAESCAAWMNTFHFYSNVEYFNLLADHYHHFSNVFRRRMMSTMNIE